MVRTTARARGGGRRRRKRRRRRRAVLAPARWVHGAGGAERGGGRAGPGGVSPAAGGPGAGNGRAAIWGSATGEERRVRARCVCEILNRAQNCTKLWKIREKQRSRRIMMEKEEFMVSGFAY
ncbi:protein CLN8 isoform X2 [Oxyura jamaicensis]|uniref:protein CLN8 isoform X2 n=1 Tax=Oxyura jamaicensis TaxID=8884 RepID=UPI0015A6E373|nr:protein CLN8 isoform X2 [Oxyura jamaicensis]